MSDTATTRADLLALTPDIYLADGYLDASGTLRRQFLQDFATAAATQLMAAQLSPQELALTVEGMRQILPLHDEHPVPRQVEAALDETFLVVARAIQQENNGGLVDWLSTCASVVGSPAELEGFLAHIQAVMRFYAILVASQPDSSGPDSSGPDSSGSASA